MVPYRGQNVYSALEMHVEHNKLYRRIRTLASLFANQHHYSLGHTAATAASVNDSPKLHPAASSRVANKFSY